MKVSNEIVRQLQLVIGKQTPVINSANLLKNHLPVYLYLFIIDYH